MVHCPKTNLNIGIKTEPVTVGADAPVDVMASVPDLTSPDILVYCIPLHPYLQMKRRFEFVLGQCSLLVVRSFLI